MTATMPEEDVDVLLEPAEPCWGMAIWNDNAIVRFPCARPAVMEMMGHCENCGCYVRRARCWPHYLETHAYLDMGVKGVCESCFQREVVLIAVLPL